MQKRILKNKIQLHARLAVKLYFVLSLLFLASRALCQNPGLDPYNIVWNSQSKNSSESMPCGGGDIGLNVWVENGEILFYISRSGTFDENNGLMKLGRVRIKLEPNPFKGDFFRQELKLMDGYVIIQGKEEGLETTINIWVDVLRPVVHVDINSTHPVQAEAIYENWRYKDRPLRKSESFANSFKWSPLQNLMTLKDSMSFEGDEVLFFHQNRKETVFDVTIHQQGMDSVKSEMYNPLAYLTYGGKMSGENMNASGMVEGIYLDTDFKGLKLESDKPSAKHHIKITLHTQQTPELSAWKKELEKGIMQSEETEKTAFENSKKWWNEYWNRSYIILDPEKKDTSGIAWQTGRNYQLFRYMIGCNAFGGYPTKFNGGLFTYDPCFTDPSRNYTPDFRNWGGGTHTAQNQRLVYFPMIKSGDFDLMKPQFDFYLNALKNAELRSKVYWGHEGACFTEQMENFGLPNCTEYGWNRPLSFDKGVEYNAWLEYQWDTSLEFCLMILETYYYTGKDIARYMPLIKSCLVFFDEHYQYLARMRGIKPLDGEGHLILYPGSACETYKMAYNATSTIAALLTVLNKLLELPVQYLNDEEKEKYIGMLMRIPRINFREIDGHITIAPAQLWERVNNTETPQLYPVFPWGIYGVGKPGLDTARNTWLYDTDAIKFRSHVGWKQDNIFAARLGLTGEAYRLTSLKLKDSGRRFPAFWGPGFDWVPDHNHGGSGMIGLQEMLMQVDGKKIFLLPAWPKDIDVHFKLYAPENTTIEMIYKNHKIEKLVVSPEDRRKDIIFL